MPNEKRTSYPGEQATAEQIARLANEYRNAAVQLLEARRPKEPLSRAPFRMVAIHSIELYLNALLIASGRSAAEVRRMQHDLGARAELALAEKLPLRKRTRQHLQVLSESREFLLTRYDPEISKASELNRLAATLNEVEDKVTIWLASKRTRT